MVSNLPPNFCRDALRRNPILRMKNNTILHFLKKKHEKDAAEDKVKVCVQKTPSNVTFIEVEKNDSLLAEVPPKWSLPSMFHRRSRSTSNGRALVKTVSSSSYSTFGTTILPKKSFSVRISPIILTGITGIKIDGPKNNESEGSQCDTEATKDPAIGYVRLWETENVVLEQGSREIVKSIPLPTGFLESEEKVTESIFIIWAQQKQRNSFFCTVNLYENDDADCESDSFKPAFIKLEIGVIVQGRECPYGVLVFDAKSLLEGQHTIESQVVECLEIPDCPVFREKMKFKNKNHNIKYQLRSESSFRMRLVVCNKDAVLENNDILAGNENVDHLWKALSIDSQDSENFVADSQVKSSPYQSISAAPFCGYTSPVHEEFDEERETQEDDEERDTQEDDREHDMKIERFLPEVVLPKRATVSKFSSMGKTCGDNFPYLDSEKTESNGHSEHTANKECVKQQEKRENCMFMSGPIATPLNESSRRSSNKIKFGHGLASKIGLGLRSRSSQTVDSKETSVPSITQASTTSGRYSTGKQKPRTYSSDADASASLVFLSEIGVPTEKSAVEEQCSNILRDNLVQKRPQRLGLSESEDGASVDRSVFNFRDDLTQHESPRLKYIESKDGTLFNFSNDFTQQESQVLSFSASTMSDFSRSAMSGTSRGSRNLSYAKLERLAAIFGIELDNTSIFTFVV